AARTQRRKVSLSFLFPIASLRPGVFALRVFLPEHLDVNSVALDFHEERGGLGMKKSRRFSLQSAAVLQRRAYQLYFMPPYFIPQINPGSRKEAGITVDSIAHIGGNKREVYHWRPRLIDHRADQRPELEDISRPVI